MKITSDIFLKETSVSKLLSFTLLDHHSSHLLFIRWRKEREKMTMEETVVELSACESLVGIMH